MTNAMHRVQHVVLSFDNEEVSLICISVLYTNTQIVIAKRHN